MSGNDRKEKVLEFIEFYYKKNHTSPSYKEIAEGTGLASTSSVERYVKQLREEGKLEPAGKGSRRKIVMAQQVLHGDDSNSVRRISLCLADGGHVSFDFTLQVSGEGEVHFAFDGIFDASELNNPVGRIVQFVEEV